MAAAEAATSWNGAAADLASFYFPVFFFFGFQEYHIVSPRASRDVGWDATHGPRRRAAGPGCSGPHIHVTRGRSPSPRTCVWIGKVVSANTGFYWASTGCSSACSFFFKLGVPRASLVDF